MSFDPRKLPLISKVHFTAEAAVRDPARTAQNTTATVRMVNVGKEIQAYEVAEGMVIVGPKGIQKVPWASVQRVEYVSPEP